MVVIHDIIDFQAVAKGLQGTVMIDLDGGGPIPPANLICRLEGAGEPVKKKKIIKEKINAGEVITEVEHDLKEETKVDGFQEPGSFSQRVTYHAPKEVGIDFNIFLIKKKCGASGDWKGGADGGGMQTASHLLLPQL